MKRMLVLCPYPQGVAAGQRLKYEQYFEDWRAAGWKIDVSSYMDSSMWDVAWEKGHLFTKVLGVLRGTVRRMRDLAHIRHYDLVYVFMWATPFGSSITERLVRAQAKALIYDVEDNILVEQNDLLAINPNPMIRWLKGRGKARYLISHADHVITSSPFLNDFCLKLNTKRACTYISSSVDTERFQPATQYSNDQPVVIGWTGTFSSKIYLDLLRGVLQRLAERIPFKLRVIGNFDYELPGVDLEVVRWSAAEEVAQLQALDIGIYPLPIDDWVLGKSGLKAIQYMAFALPCVATNVGTTPMLIRDGENGLLVQTEAEWEAALERLIQNPALRQKLGQAARKDVLEKYSIAAIAVKYSTIINHITEK
jgi:glycosyltransferase involved in cell wall biosynthesis